MIGVVFGELLKPGHGMYLDVVSLDTQSVESYIAQGASQQAQSVGEEIYHILLSAIPHDPITPFVEGKTLQVLVMALVVAILLSFVAPSFKEKCLRYFESMQELSLKC